MQENELQLWIRKMIKGDQQAFQIIYEHTRDHVYRTVTFLVSNQQDVSDIVSEVYIELFKSLPNYDYNQSFRSWLNGLIIRQVSHWKRKEWRKLRLFERRKLLELEVPNQKYEDKLVRDENDQELTSCVKRLPYKLRVVIILRYYQDHSMEEIATLLNIPVGTVKSRHHNALKKLRKTAEHPFNSEEGSVNVH